MDKNKIIFIVFFVYFIVAMLMHSTLITIEQAIYTYALDKSKSSILLVIEYIAVILAAFLMSELIRTISYRKLLVPCLIFILSLGIIIPFSNHFLFPQLLFLGTGVIFVIARTVGYMLIREVAKQDKVFASLLNRFEAMFVLAFIISWAIAGGFANTRFSWTYLFWVIGGLSLLALGLIFTTDFKKKEEVRELHLEEKKSLWHDVFLHLFSRLYHLIFSLFSKSKKGAWSFFEIFRYSMVLMLALNLAFLSMAQVHFMQWIPSLSKQYIANLNADIYLVMLAFAGLFFGRIFASFILHIFNVFYVLIGSMALCIVCIFMTSYYANVNSEPIQISALSDLPSFFWAIPLLGFVWGPVMPTLSAIILSSVSKEKIPVITSLIIAVIFIIEAICTGVSAFIFESLSVNVAFLLGMLPMIMLLIITLLFINDIKNTENKNIEKINPTI
ncbi:MFS transporter [Thermoflexibacter ruber]|uniref:Major Facilitator Superfamily protein n=1 Tax=Thermoflexibacter ruber TaxID=1003 RepID=A0A1I2GEY4_9BACT|nr:MFS transporter [Thermoflexibacter ruber]SFF16135.1 Major Facilitator Superfamily protein [Thermoflexibacter ruber]